MCLTPTSSLLYLSFVFNHTPTTDIYTLSLHDALPICLEASHRDLGEVASALCEFRLEVGEYAEQIVGEQDLPVGAIARADADGRDLELARDHRGDLRRHGLEFEHKAASVLDGESILEDLHRRI